MTETTYYTDERGVRITNARAVFGPKTYAMSNISSVSIHITPPNRTTGFAIVLMAFIFICCSFGSITRAGEGTNLIGMLIGLSGMAQGVLLIVRAKPIYAVQIASTSGEVQAASSLDRAYIDALVNALN